MKGSHSIQSQSQSQSQLAGYSIEPFKNRHYNEVMFILGSGASMEHYHECFFMMENAYSIGVNRIVKWFPCDYVITHHHEIIPEIQGYNEHYCNFFVSRYHRCEIKGEVPNHTGKDYYVYDHCNQGFSDTDFSPLDDEDFQEGHPNHILTGGNTVINAIGLAVYMGAKNIVLVGCDGGSINCQTNLNGYHPDTTGEKIQQHGHSVRSLALNMEVRHRLSKLGVSLVSLSPFLDLGLEGNKFWNHRPETDDPKFIELYNKYRLK